MAQLEKVFIFSPDATGTSESISWVGIGIGGVGGGCVGVVVVVGGVGVGGCVVGGVGVGGCADPTSKVAKLTDTWTPRDGRIIFNEKL
jgi:hypothetical protein